MHGLVKTICKLIQIQAIQLGKDGDESVWSLYGIRLVLHSFYLETIITFCLISRKKKKEIKLIVDFCLTLFLCVLLCSHCAGSHVLAQVAHRGCGISILGDYRA